MSQDLVIGIDSSTSATKAIAWDRSGQAVAEARAAIPMSNPLPGHFEQDAEDWWKSTVSALQALAAQIDAGRVAALAISNQRESFGTFRHDGTSLRPATLWLDERSRQQVSRFGQSFGSERVHAISGKPLDVIPCLYRMIWLREHEPKIFEKTERMADVHGYLVFRLTGEWATSTASADPMGVLDMRTQDWSDTILDAAGVPRSMMSSLSRPGRQLGAISAKSAAQTGLKPGTAVIAGGGDGQCAGTGVGMLVPGRAYVNMGTAVVSGSFGREYVYELGFRTMNAIAEEGFIYETCLRAGTFLVEWLLREMFGLDARHERHMFLALEAEAATSPIGAGGVVISPYWQGCMMPHWDSSARGVIAGLSGSSRRGDVYRALLEGIALEQAYSTNRAVAGSGQSIDQYVAMGGGASSDLWAQILADASGRPVLRSTTVEASSLGAAMAAAKGAGWFDTIDEASAAMASRPSRVFDPDPKSAARYAELLAIHAALWPTLSQWNAKLTAFTEAGQS
jgi:sugar (pentulose or hexulose) kinase